jgi:hypothetical protein
VSRPRRNPAPAGRVDVLCSGRGDPDHGELRHIVTLQMQRHDDGEVTFTGRGGPPIEGHCYVFRCGTCRRNLKIRKERMLPLVTALAEQQDTHGETPIRVDISVIERAV